MPVTPRDIWSATCPARRAADDTGLESQPPRACLPTLASVALMLLALGLLLSVNGCAKSYNGGFSLAPHEMEQVEEYRQAREMRKNQLDRMAMAQRGIDPVAFYGGQPNHPAAQGRHVTPAGYNNPYPNATASFVSNNASSSNSDDSASPARVSPRARFRPPASDATIAARDDDPGKFKDPSTPTQIRAARANAQSAYPQSPYPPSAYAPPRTQTRPAGPAFQNPATQPQTSPQTNLNGYAPTPVVAVRPGTSVLSLFGDVGPQAQRNANGAVGPTDAAQNLRRITFTTEGSDFDPDVDSSGQWLVYASTRHRETSDLYIKRVGENAITQLTRDFANEAMPAISPDGSLVAYASDRNGNWDIYIMQAAGGKSVQITADPAPEIHPSFSPDGKKLVYCTFGAQSGQWELTVVDLENPTTNRMIGFGLFPEWSPVGDKIVYQQARQRGTRWFSIWTLEITQTGDAVRPTELAAASNAALINPEWSPDGKHIAFATVVDPEAGFDHVATADVWVMDAAGNGRVQLTGGEFANLQPTWSAEGEVLFVSNRSTNGAENIWSLSPEKALELSEPVIAALAQPRKTRAASADPADPRQSSQTPAVAADNPADPDNAQAAVQP